MKYIKVGIYYYTDEDGNKTYDEDSMKEEFKDKLNNLISTNANFYDRWREDNLEQ